MKIILQLLVCCLITSCATNSNMVSIPANQTLTVATPDYELCEVSIKNKSFQNIGIKVVKEDTDEFVRGFGLGKQGREEVLVEENAQLQLTNETNKAIKVGLSFQEKKPRIAAVSNKTVSFTLANTSMKSIPLIIPSVMNPNLSPRSESGVGLKMGQEILFRKNGKKHILLVVDETIKDGDVVDVATLMKERKEELGL